MNIIIPRIGTSKKTTGALRIGFGTDFDFYHMERDKNEYNMISKS